MSPHFFSNQLLLYFILHIISILQHEDVQTLGKRKKTVSKMVLNLRHSACCHSSTRMLTIETKYSYFLSAETKYFWLYFLALIQGQDIKSNLCTVNRQYFPFIAYHNRYYQARVVCF